jgi:hypothetical protein
MNNIVDENRAVTASKAVELLRRSGTKISLEEAEIILDFMYKMGKLTVENFNKSKVKPGSQPKKKQ